MYTYIRIPYNKNWGHTYVRTILTAKQWRWKLTHSRNMLTRSTSMWCKLWKHTLAIMTSTNNGGKAPFSSQWRRLGPVELMGQSPQNILPSSTSPIWFDITYTHAYNDSVHVMPLIPDVRHCILSCHAEGSTTVSYKTRWLIKYLITLIKIPVYFTAVTYMYWTIYSIIARSFLIEKSMHSLTISRLNSYFSLRYLNQCEDLLRPWPIWRTKCIQQWNKTSVF